MHLRHPVHSALKAFCLVYLVVTAECREFQKEILYILNVDNLIKKFSTFSSNYS